MTDHQPELEDTLTESGLEHIVRAVRWCLVNRQSLTQTLTALREQQLRGEHVQSELSEVYGNCPPLVTVAFVTDQHDIRTVIDAAVGADLLTEKAGERFLTWWAEMKWIADGLEAFLDERAHRPNKPWTETQIEFRRSDGRLVATHSVNYGVDSVHETQAPVEDLFDECVWRLDTITDRIQQEVKEGDQEISQRLLEEIHSHAETIAEIAETLEDWPTSSESTESVSQSDNNSTEDFEELLDSVETNDDRELADQ
uniref:hypothetical protein n=1 Tax=Halobaculum sp. EA56 TaxID=3421648 RepID=UPI003EBC59DC